MKRLTLLLLAALGTMACSAAFAPRDCGARSHTAQSGETVPVQLEAGCTDTIYVGFTPGPQPSRAP